MHIAVMLQSKTKDISRKRYNHGLRMNGDAPLSLRCIVLDVSLVLSLMSPVVILLIVNCSFVNVEYETCLPHRTDIVLMAFNHFAEQRNVFVV